MRQAGAASPLKTSLVLGHHDADGVVSAALVGAFLGDIGCRDTRYGIVDFPHLKYWPTFGAALISGHIPGWKRPDWPSVLGIVDFPAADVPDDVGLFYADHHEDSFSEGVCVAGGGERLSERLRRRAETGRGMVYHQPDAGSCAMLLTRCLGREWGWAPPPRLALASEFAHGVDTAAYRSASEAVDFRRHPLARLNAACLGLTAEELAISAAALADGVDLDSALYSQHAASLERIQERLDASLESAASRLRRLTPAFVLIDWVRDANRTRPVRFAEFHWSDAPYAARMEEMPADSGCHIQITLTRSPWARLPEGRCHPDLCRIAQSLGGGGHPYAAGFAVRGSIRSETRAVARRLVASIADAVRPLDPDHPMALDRS